MSMYASILPTWMQTTTRHYMHIPDGFLSAPVAIVGWGLAILAIGYALRQTRTQLGERQVPLMGLMAAFIFAAQMLNFPVAGGTSGHLLGGALAAIVLGPWAAVLVMASVIGVQALLFQDGGLLALGWNVVNMGVLTAFTGYLVYRGLRVLLGPGHRARLAAAVIGAWLSVEVGAVATAVELAVSGTSPLAVALPAMAGVHALIGIGEAIITAGAVSFIAASRPDLLEAGQAAPGQRSATWVTLGLLIALGVTLLSPLASPMPDGLERVAMEAGFLHRAVSAPYHLFPNYTFPGIPNPALATILAGAFGVLVVFGVAYLIGRLREEAL